MGTPEPAAPIPEDDPSTKSAEWLVGADEGLAAEMERRASQSIFLARPALLRPGTPAEAGPSGAGKPDDGPSTDSTRLPALPRPLPLPISGPASAGAPPRRFGAVTPDMATDAEFDRGPAMTWEPGARSVPSLQPSRPVRPATPASAPAPTRDFPMDDAEERARDRAAVLEGAMADALAASRPHEVVSPEAFDAVAVTVPWWIHIADVLRTDRRLQALVVVVLAVLTAISVWPRGEMPTAIGRLRRHAVRYDGEAVHVAGKVGQVFHMGGGYAFYLMDGRDTLVVFTRVRVPVERQHVDVRGTMSNGSLDGQPTLALFESADSGH